MAGVWAVIRSEFRTVPYTFTWASASLATSGAIASSSTPGNHAISALLLRSIDFHQQHSRDRAVMSAPPVMIVRSHFVRLPGTTTGGQ
jgi:hypothetical protein